MNIRLNLSYHTNFGEEVVVNVLSWKDGARVVTPYRMTTTDGELWSCDLLLHLRSGSVIDYYYSVLYGSEEVINREWIVVPHRLELSSLVAQTYVVYDHWIALPEDSYQYSSAFTDCLHHHHVTALPTVAYRKTLRVKVRAPQLRSDERLVLVGDLPLLGSWHDDRGIAMTEQQYHEWVADIDATDLEAEMIEFKFAVVNKDGTVAAIWEDRYNRVLVPLPIADAEVLVYELDTALFPICNVRVAGTLVPVFSLRSQHSYGVGDFGDLRLMVDWVCHTHQRLLQVLPINDTTTTHTWTDSYPYSAISIFALHPQYIDLSQLPPIADEQLREEYESLRIELNALPQIDYERVNDAKQAYLQILYSQDGAQVLQSAGFKTFFAENSSWLVPYAQYSLLRERYGTADFTTWTGHEQFHESDRAALSNPQTKGYKEVAYYYYVQYLLSCQLSAVHSYAQEKGVILKGDIPIGVNRYGSDVWQAPHYFNLSGQAGAPPDDFSVNGQNWGFPTYNWQAMLADDCRWWKARFANMSKYFDAYRIDHVLGFFRIWEIPIDAVHGLLGQFAPALGLSREEIEAYGLHFQEELFTAPFITDWTLDRIFGDRAWKVKETYLEPLYNGYYRLRKEYNTQRKIEQAFSHATETEEIYLRDGLYALVSDVLFVRDHKDKNKFHPRISAQFDFVYESLYDSDKALFNKIYNDYYYRRNNHFWYREAMNKLPKIVEATRMLVCAEDLGMVPECVAWAMNDLRILSLELQSMPKDPHTRFGILERNPYRSVCTISSHDTPTLRQWWDEDYWRTQDYYNNVLYKYGAAPHPLPGWLARDIIARHLWCPSMLCILSIQDWLAIDENIRLADANAERVNIPANPKHYWRYRMHLTIEELLAKDDFNHNLIDLIKASGRN